jgi:tetrapyrrole methylase family protein/MazG family protein
VICGLGPGRGDAVTDSTRRALAGDRPIYLRTARHPSAGLATEAASFVRSFDDIYENAASFDDVYTEITETLIDAAQQAEAVDGDTEPAVIYAVPGSPLVLERSVRDLRRRAHESGVDVELLPALSFLDEAWTALGVDPVDDGVRLVDGHRFAVEAADQRGPLLVAHAHARWVLSNIKLAVDAGPEQRAVVLQALGTDDQRIIDVAWPDLDRVVEPDHLTTLYIPELAAPVGQELARSVEMMDRLRTECPWDREQDHHSLRRYLIEEAYEVVEAIDRMADSEDAAYPELEEELGDLLFQILFHARLASEAGQFTLADVARTLTDKMIHRHPHVYGDGGAPDENSWEQLKAEEKLRQSAMDDLPLALPALALADKMFKRAERAGNRPDLGNLALDVERLLPDDATAEEVAVVVLAVSSRSRQLGVPAEQSVRDAIRAAVQRYQRQELTGSVASNWVTG